MEGIMMGAGLIGRAFAYAADVPLQPNEFRLLIGMCLTALDADEPPRYFDSREAMALALGRRVTDDGPDRKAAFQRVKIAVQGLNAVAAIKTSTRGGNGHRAVYDILLDTAASLSTAEVAKRAAGVRSATLAGVRSTTPLGYAERAVGVRPTYPLGIKEPQGELEEPHSVTQPPHQKPVDNSNRSKDAA